MRREIYATKHHLFNDSEVLYQFKNFIIDLVECANLRMKLSINWNPKSGFPFK